MHIIWFSWKDIKHPLAGGAEIVTDELCSRAIKDGHKVTLITSRPKDSKEEEKINGYRVLRGGNRYTVYLHAWRRYRDQFRDQGATVVEEINTVPFFTRLYVRQTRITFYHQLARQIWFYEYFFPLNVIGYLAEPLYTRINRADKAIAMSKSTKGDLLKYGYRDKQVQIISEGIKLKPVKNLEKIKKTNNPSLLSFGSLRPMKRTLDIVDAFDQAKESIPDLTLTLAGKADSHYGRKVLSRINTSPYKKDINYIGPVADNQIPALLSKHHFLVSSAVKEGWGLTITEAASQGTPAIAYDVDGQRDAVNQGKTGIMCEANVSDLTETIISSFSQKFDYNSLQQKAWSSSKAITFVQTYKDFVKLLDLQEPKQ